MISSERILTEIEKHLERARPEDDANVRETLAAIRALCDVVLGDEQPPAAKRRTPVPRQLAAQPVREPQKAAPVLYESRLEEDDANGDSLFDF